MDPHDRESTDPLREGLRTLPREHASADFTQRLLAQPAAAGATLPRRTAWPRLAVATVLALALLGGLYAREQRRELEALDQRQALRQRHLELKRDLAELRAQVSHSPTLWVGTARDFDVVLDLGPWIDHPSLQPAVYQAARQ